MRLPSVSLALLPLALASPVSKRQAECYSGVYVIVAPPHNNATPGLQQSLIDSVLNTISGSGSYVVPYDSGNPNYGTGIANGEELMRQEIDSYVSSCPNSAIVLMGYSQGGIVMMNTICGDPASGDGNLPSSYASNIIGAIGYGQETWVAGQSYDAGTCPSTGASEHPRTELSTCEAFASSIQDYCDTGDPRCCGGEDTGAHGTYNHYDSDATDFISSRYNSFAGKKL